MISVIVPTLDDEAGLPATLSALVPAAADGFVREVIVADAGSRDHTLAIADGMGCVVIAAPRGRGAQWRAGAEAARGPWLLFLRADTVLAEGWLREAKAFVDPQDRLETKEQRAAVFRFALDSFARKARLTEAAIRARAAVLGVPTGEQGLLVSRRLYDAVGGHRPLAAMEDADIARRIGRSRIITLRTPAIASAAAYERIGYVRRGMAQTSRLALFLAGVSPDTLARRRTA